MKTLTYSSMAPAEGIKSLPGSAEQADWSLLQYRSQFALRTIALEVRVRWMTSSSRHKESKRFGDSRLKTDPSINDPAPMITASEKTESTYMTVWAFSLSPLLEAAGHSTWLPSRRSYEPPSRSHRLWSPLLEDRSTPCWRVSVLADLVPRSSPGQRRIAVTPKLLDFFKARGFGWEPDMSSRAQP